MKVPCVLAILAICALNEALPVQEAISISAETMNAAGPPSTTFEMMNGMEGTHEAPAQAHVAVEQREPPKPASAAGKTNLVTSTEFTRQFLYEAHANCKNRAYIMTTYLHQSTHVECQRKCAADRDCTGFNVFRNTDGVEGTEGECTIFKGACEVMSDGAHDLYLSVVPGSFPPSAQTIPGPQDVKPAAPAAAAAAAAPAPAPAPAPAKVEAATMLNITIVSPTVRRFQRSGEPAPEQYLSPMVHKLWGDLTPEQQQLVNFIILNSDKHPEKHVEALELKSMPHVQVLTKPNWDEELERQLRSTGSIHENGEVFLEDGRQVNMEWIKWVAAEDLDGAYLLELASRQSPYVLFLEDDVYPTTNALEKLTKFVHNMKNDDWLFLDLYTPNLDWAEGMLDVKNGQKYNFQCCTQAMLFRSDLLPGIINYWRTHPAEPVDDNLREYRKNVMPDHFIYATRPNLFQHVGAYSSNPQKSTGIVEHTSIEFIPLLFQTDAKTVEQVEDMVVRLDV